MLVLFMVYTLLKTMAPNGKAVEVHEGTQDDKNNNERKKKSNTHLKLPKEIGTDYTFKRKIVWFNAIGFLMIHLAGVYGIYLALTLKAHIFTTVCMLALSLASGEGVTVGAHRLYSHKSFKAKFPLRLALIILQTIAGQNCMYIWVRDHRQHHKYSDTDADPHNANRGFFFSHIGWLMSRKHPAVLSKGKTIDMTDLEADSLVMFQKTFYKSLYIIFAMALPIGLPVWLWNETYYNSLFVSFFTRYVLMLNVTWLVNSAAHFYGNKPYDQHMRPVESKFVSYLSFGEGWHNYHHAFPWDYKAAEFGTRYSFTTFIINLFAYLGLAYDLRTTSPEMIAKRIQRTGDGTHINHDDIMAQISANRVEKIKSYGDEEETTVDEVNKEVESEETIEDIGENIEASGESENTERRVRFVEKEKPYKSNELMKRPISIQG